MKAFLFYLVLFLFIALFPIYRLKHNHPYHATWTGERWSCPKGLTVYADENEALSDKQDFAYCVR